MSARFGRNQRRKMREAHAEELALQAMLLRMSQAALADQSTAYQREKAARVALEREVVEWARRIVSQLDDDSSFARLTATRDVDQWMYEAVRDGQPYRLPARTPVEYRIVDEPMPLTTALRVIEAFATVVDVARDDIRYRVRFLVRNPAGAAALMMDERTRHDLMRHGDEGLARYLLKQLVAPWMAGKVGK